MEKELLNKHGIVFARKPAVLGLSVNQLFPGRLLVCNPSVLPQQGFTDVVPPNKVCHYSCLKAIVKLENELEGEASKLKKASGDVYEWEVTVEEVRGLGLGVEVQVGGVTAGASCEQQMKVRLKIECPTFRECQNLNRLMKVFQPHLEGNVAAQRLEVGKTKTKERQVLRFYFITKVLYATKAVLSWKSSSGIDLCLAAGAQGVEVGGDAQRSSGYSEKSISISWSEDPMPWGMQLHCQEYFIKLDKGKGSKVYSCCFSYGGQRLQAWPKGKKGDKKVDWPDAAGPSTPGNMEPRRSVGTFFKKLNLFGKPETKEFLTRSHKFDL